MLRPCAILLSIALGLTFAAPASAQWKWREKSGGKESIKYSDLPPPPGVPDSDILQRPAARAVTAPVASSAASASAPLLVPKGIEPELEAQRKKKEADEAAAKKANEDKLAAQRADNCGRAKSQLRTIDDGVRLARTNDKGEREILNDQQRAAEAQRARDMIASDCK